MTDLPTFPRDISAERYERLLNPVEPFAVPAARPAWIGWAKSIAGLAIIILLFWSGINVG